MGCSFKGHTKIIALLGMKFHKNEITGTQTITSFFPPNFGGKLSFIPSFVFLELLLQ
jgi:hypothetical protein